MRERLMQLLGEAIEPYLDRIYPWDTFSDIADYLLDNGVIVLPAHIGQTVWIIDEYEVFEDVIYEVGNSVVQLDEKKWLFLVEDSGMDFYDSDIGKTVFTTREAAEAALKAREKQ